MKLIERLSVVELIRIPVWIFDCEKERMVWANSAALGLWTSPALPELLARDFSDMSEATRAQIRSWLPALRRSERVELDWMAFPKGVPVMMRMVATGIELDDGRLGILQTATQKEELPAANLLRGTEALRHTSIVVALLAESGAVLMRNPAAIRAFGDEAPVDAWFVGAAIVPEMLRAVQGGEVYHAEVASRAGGVDRFHLLEARPALDPVTGAKAVLVHLFDDTARRTAQRSAEAKGRHVENLSTALATVEAQQREILELSAPILRIGRRSLAVPVIGVLDRPRGDELATRLLPAVTAERASSVVLDLTGVSVPDDAGLNALLRIVRSVRLLGAQAILTGIRPALAAALATEGVLLEGARILRSLAEGIDASRRAERARRGRAARALR